MSEIIQQYYKNNHYPDYLFNKKMDRFNHYPDIAAEFEYWIENKKYIDDGAVNINGYTAKKLALLSEHLNGEGAFMMLIDLKENPQRALAQIAKGFKIK